MDFSSACLSFGKYTAAIQLCKQIWSLWSIAFSIWKFVGFDVRFLSKLFSDFWITNSQPGYVYSCQVSAVRILNPVQEGVSVSGEMHICNSTARSGGAQTLFATNLTAPTTEHNTKRQYIWSTGGGNLSVNIHTRSTVHLLYRAIEGQNWVQSGMHASQTVRVF